MFLFCGNLNREKNFSSYLLFGFNFHRFHVIELYAGFLLSTTTITMWLFLSLYPENKNKVFTNFCIETCRPKTTFLHKVEICFFHGF